MRLRFTIRDLLWLAVVVALAVAWWIDHKGLIKRSREFAEQAVMNQEMIKDQNILLKAMQADLTAKEPRADRSSE